MCRRGLTGYDAAWSFGEYDGALRELIHLYKYDGIRPLAGPLGRLLLAAVPRSQHFDVVVPMPLHWTRRWRRGFNQAELIARGLARQLNVGCVSALSRVRPTASQAGLTNAQRRENVRGAFRIGNKSAIAGGHVLLVDDVLTTGATVSAAAAALKRGGAKRVSVLTLARADRRKIAFSMPEVKVRESPQESSG